MYLANAYSKLCKFLACLSHFISLLCLPGYFCYICGHFLHNSFLACYFWLEPGATMVQPWYNHCTTGHSIKHVKDGCSTVVKKVDGLDWMDGSLGGVKYRAPCAVGKIGLFVGYSFHIYLQLWLVLWPHSLTWPHQYCS